jgi:hypothetical protein
MIASTEIREFMPFVPGTFGGGSTREAQHGVTLASPPVVSSLAYLWGYCPQTPGIFRFEPEVG